MFGLEKMTQRTCPQADKQAGSLPANGKILK
jgi:hypothetical protein